MAEKSTHPPLLFPLPPPRSTRRNEKIEKKEAEEEGAFIRRAKGPLPFPFWETLDARKMPGAFQRRRERDAGNILRPLDLGFGAWMWLARLVSSLAAKRARFLSFTIWRCFPGNWMQSEEETLPSLFLHLSRRARTERVLV